MKKSIALLLMAILTITLIACTPSETATTYEVRFFDDTAVLRTVQVEEGQTVERPTDLESKDGYTFVWWYSTPSKNHRFSFDQTITANVNVYAGFSQYEEDTRDWYILGSGTSNLLASNNWGNDITEEHLLEDISTDTENKFTITLDLMAGDEFQFGGPQWIHKRGYGYLLTNQDDDGNDVFTGAGGGLGEVSSKGMNIKVAQSGNYTLTLGTYPADDTYDTNDPSYTEEQKEIYNYGTYDYIEWVRNGDPIEVPDVITSFYIKGSGITQWLDVFNNDTQFSQDGNIHTLKVYLEAEEEFLFTSRITVAGSTSSGTEFIRGNNLDDTSAELFEVTAGGNMITEDAGLYTFTFNFDTKVLSVTLDAEYTEAEADYYLTGVIGDDTWGDQVNTDFVNEDYRFTYNEETDTYDLEIELAVGEQFTIEALKAGSTGRGTWGTEDYNQLATYNFNYLVPNTAFEAFDLTGEYPNYNIKPVEDGTYIISFNAYSNLITISLVE